MPSILRKHIYYGHKIKLPLICEQETLYELYGIVYYNAKKPHERSYTNFLKVQRNDVQNWFFVKTWKAML